MYLLINDIKEGKRKIIPISNMIVETKISEENNGYIFVRSFDRGDNYQAEFKDIDTKNCFLTTNIGAITDWLSGREINSGIDVSLFEFMV